MAASSTDISRDLVWNRRLLLLGAGAVAATTFTFLAFRQFQRRRQRRARRRLALRLSSRYACAVVTEAAQRQHFEIDSNAPCQLGDFSRLDWNLLLGEHGASCRRSCLYLRAGLVRKGMLAHYLTKRKQEGVLPPGFAVDVEDEEDIQSLKTLLCKNNPIASTETASRQPTWIAKSSNANRGEHLYLSHSVDEVVGVVRKAALEGPEPIVEWVVQRYIHPPLLVDGCKFHLRAHFLVSGSPYCGTTRAWLHEASIVALVSAIQYHTGDISEDRFRHLTNHCVQEAHPCYDEAKQILLLEEVAVALGRPHLVQDVTSAVTSAISAALSAAGSAPVGFAPLPQCFELFGADFALEDRGDATPGVYLLEVNAGPDLGIFGERLREKCVSMISDVLQVAVEPYILCDMPRTFKDPSKCPCVRAIGGTSFGKCLWQSSPRKTSAVEELGSFTQRMHIAGKWVKSRHEHSGIEVRGAQAEIAK